MKRGYESILREYLRFFPCVALIGARQCGKTTLLETLPKSWKCFDLEKQGDFNLICDDPDLFFRLNPNNTAIDEAQLHPDVFNALRVAIDADRNRKGRFIITGSSSPLLLRSVSESLAGRVGIIEMSPLCYREITPNRDSPFFRFFEKGMKFDDMLLLPKPKGTLQQIHTYWFEGGFPEPWLSGSRKFKKVWKENYFKTYVERDISRLYPSLNFNRFRTFLHMLAGLSGSIVNYSEVARTLGVSQPTVREYFEIAHHTFIWRNIQPYGKNVHKKIVKHPKGYMRDSGVAHHLLRIVDLESLLTHPQSGNSWESMVIEEILRGLHLRGVDHDYAYYRTHAGAEIDLILEGDFGLVPIEIKHRQTLNSRELLPIKQFISEHHCEWGTVIFNGEQPVKLDERLIAMPFNFI